MEKSVESIKRGYSSVTLAYLGDAFYETLVREHIVGDGDCRVAALNEDAKRFVTAAAQSRIIGALLPDLTEEEELFYKKRVCGRIPACDRSRMSFRLSVSCRQDGARERAVR